MPTTRKPVQRKPVQRKPGRPRKNEIQERLSIYTKHDEQVKQEHDTWLEIDISTPHLPNQVMKIDKVDYEALKSDLVGRFFAKISAAHNTGPIAYTHTRTKDNKFSSNPSYVHNLICKGNGFLWHRNSDQLDNRRANLETNLPLQTSTVGSKKSKSTAQTQPLNISVLLADYERTPKAKAPKEFAYSVPKPTPNLKSYDPNAKHEIIDLLTGKPETIEETKNENQKG